MTALLDQLGGAAALLEGGALPPHLLAALPLHHWAALLLLIYIQKNYQEAERYALHKSRFSIFNLPTVMILIPGRKNLSTEKNKL
jgi:hypothetical protein